MTNDDKPTPREHPTLDKTHSRRRLLTSRGPTQVESKSQESVPANDEVVWRLKLQSSDCFERIMGDIEGKMVEKIKRHQQITRNKLTSESKTTVVGAPVILLELEDDDDTNKDGRNDAETRISPSRVKAKRAWALIRRYIREQSMNKKQNKSNFQWSMLQQTLKNMTNMDAARGDLYNKYLNPTNPRSWADGIKSIPAGFFAKHTKELMRKSAPPISPMKAKARKPKSAATEKSFRSRRSYKV